MKTDMFPEGMNWDNSSALLNKTAPAAGHKESLWSKVERCLEEAGVEMANVETARILTVAGACESRALALAEERCKGIPLGYVIGRERFMGIELVVAPGALVPRLETELLGNTAAALLHSFEPDGTDLRMIDMCCGAGNLACGISARFKNLSTWASDLTGNTVALARRNVTRLRMAERVTVVQGDLFGSLTNYGLEGSIDLIVCNPPYIPSERLTQDHAELLNHEPREAFDGGPYGLSIYQRVIQEGAAFLKPGKPLLFEIGVGQSKAVTFLFNRSKAFGPVKFVTDGDGEPRVAMAWKLTN